MTPHDQLIEKYQKCSDLERAILDLVSFAGEGINRTVLMKLLSHMGIKHDNRQFVHATIKPFVDRLITQQLLAETPYGSRQTLNLTCHLKLQEWIVQQITDNDERLKSLVDAISTILPSVDTPSYAYSYGRQYIYPNERSTYRLMRDIRFGLFTNNNEMIAQSMDYAKRLRMDLAMDPQQIINLIDKPFRPEWLATRNEQIQLFCLSYLFHTKWMQLDEITPYVNFVEHELSSPGSHTPVGVFVNFQIQSEILRGNFQQVRKIFDIYPNLKFLDLYKAMMACLQGKFAESLEAFNQYFNYLKSETGKRNITLGHFPAFFYLAALIKTAPPKYQAQYIRYLRNEMKTSGYFEHSLRAFEMLGEILQSRVVGVKENLRFLLKDTPDPLNTMFTTLVSCWYFPELLNHGKDNLIYAYRRAKRFGYRWLECELAGMLSRLEPESAPYQASISLAETMQIQPLFKLVGKIEPWERALDALINFGVGSSAAAPAADTRLVWMLSFYEQLKSVNIQPKEQKLGKSGNWSAGRNVAVKRLIDNDLDCMTDQDRRVVRHIFKEDRYYGGTYYYIDETKALPELAGDPLLFLENSPKTPVELLKSEPALLLEKKDKGYVLRFSETFEESGIKIIKESQQRYRVLVIKPEHMTIRQIMNNNQLQVPESAKEKLLEAVGNISRNVQVHSAVEGTHSSIEAVSASADIHLHMLPLGNGFRLDMLVRPFGNAGPYYPPGQTPEQIITEVEGKRLQTRRDLKLEKEKALDILNQCPALKNTHDGSYEWRFETPEDCLEALSDLEEIREQVKLEWPEGEKLRIHRQLSSKNLFVGIQRENDWFSLQGEVRIDENKVMQIHELLNLLHKSNGRFIEISDGQFVALTRQFRKQLEELQGFSESSGKRTRFHHLLAPVFDDLLKDIGGFKADPAWQESLERLKSVENHVPKPPSTLQAVLRDYQVEGFQWLSRLAKWGVGACLADDMGLGKTVQALAAILERAPDGPTLVIAPASVVPNWISETQRFSPTLNPISFAEVDRLETIGNLAAFDLLVCSYGLLPYEIESLKNVQWQTIVLDEAQSIKNAATKRSQAAMQLEGGFKIITTGTPVENHLGELWNLFRFINPGLLGSLARFNEKFATPIEKYNDLNARQRLKRLVQPFILRRLKNEVLSELPPKTEISLTVELSTEERAFYEALRQRALERLENGQAAAEDMRFQILAELMRLRRAACHPRLVTPEIHISSSKLAVFAETLAELLENNHKVLVFSQFVDHLTVVREYLDGEKITYQYLDGSTPNKKRQEAVRNFQSGEGDVFLISLRAGGLGLNLTAADYVIHLDPWWNPAVEDQASDRSHRIGQQRPVTVYRLIAKDTIEEKIIALHHNKKDLADSLLEGTDATGKITAEELLEILREA